MKLYRQGDVLFRRVRNLPGNPYNWKTRPDGIVAYGEVTGHAHRLSLEDQDIGEVFDVDNKTYVRVTRDGISIHEKPRGAKFVHEEHATVTLPPGIYEVQMQREYVPVTDPHDKTWAYVRD